MDEASGENQQMVTSADESATDAVFSNDGQWIIFSSENDDVTQVNIYKVPSSGSGTAVPITTHGGYGGAPSVSPDGSQVAFESTAGDPSVCGISQNYGSQ